MMRVLKKLWSALKWRLYNAAICFDQLAGALFLGTHADMTISAQAWLWHIQGKSSWPYKLIDAIFFLEERHCYKAFESELTRKHLPPEARETP